MTDSYADSRIDHPAWRRPAPRARRLAMALYAWRDPGWVFLASVLAASPFLLAAIFAPALLSLSPTVDMIAPIAKARAVSTGAASMVDEASPFYLWLLLAGDIFTDTPGRIHLLAKAFAAALVAYPLAYFSAARFPASQTILGCAAFAAYVASPFAGIPEIALAFFAVLAVSLNCAPADEGRERAIFEGALSGVILFILWTLNPVFSLLGFMALSACPFLTGRAGLERYGAAMAILVLLAGGLEYLLPGINFARADAASTLFAQKTVLVSGASALGLTGVAVSTAVVLFSAAVFGGREHIRGWLSGAVLLFFAVLGARVAGANAMPIFALSAAMASLSVASPFYDGIFKSHDRASVSMAAAAATLTLFWTIALILHSAGQFALQYQVARAAPADIRTQLGLVQPGGPTIAQWIEEGRFSTPEARELFAIAPVDQSAMLLEAAARARQFVDNGVEVAILTGADTACVLAPSRSCVSDGRAAADNANVVLVPRLDLDPATALMRGKTEVLLYTEFVLMERTALWEVWVRRGVTLPQSLTKNAGIGI